MNVEEMLAGVKNWFKTSVEPNIQQGNLLVARIEMSNLYLTIREDYARHFAPYASGTSFVAAAGVLEKAIIDGKDLSEEVEMFNAYLGQLGLAIKAGNKARPQ